jgi:hypothetical protein
MDSYKARKKDLSDVYDLIVSTVASQYRPHIIDQATPWGVLTALKKQVAPSLRTQKLALAREYNALKRNSKGQNQSTSGYPYGNLHTLKRSRSA